MLYAHSFFYPPFREEQCEILTEKQFVKCSTICKWKSQIPVTSIMIQTVSILNCFDKPKAIIYLIKLLILCIKYIEN